MSNFAVVFMSVLAFANARNIISDGDQILSEDLNTIPDLFHQKNLDLEHRFNSPLKYGLPLNPDDFESGRKLTEKDIKYEGDTDPTESDIVAGHRGQIGFKNALANPNSLWSGGKIYYLIDNIFDSRDRSIIARAMEEFHTNTCIRFIPRSYEKNYIYITRNQGCFSMIGVTGGKQDVSLGNGCMYVGIVAHELMHATGFFHEQSRADRDDYISVVWNNIMNGMEFNFQKQTMDVMTHLDEKYDYSSIMHYGATSFARDPNYPTIIPKQKDAVIGQRERLSTVDLRKINKLYHCDITPGAKTEKPIETISKVDNSTHCDDTDKNCQSWSLTGECTKNPDWMLINCAKSCKQCDEECVDSNPYCNLWAEKNECVANPSYMLINCQKSCGTCKGKLKLCKDQNAGCDEWSKNGYCKQYRTYMRNYCAKSCDMC